MTRNITLTINGKKRSDAVEPRMLLIHYLREVNGLTGPHIGCETPICGGCTVHLDCKPVKSSTMLAVQWTVRDVPTMEDLAKASRPHPMQDTFWKEDGVPGCF